ncbi:hypothetical protein BB560_005420 [Smittium megazygosporum]|uniref:Uncharacterized protein n=1 Tax=Smittium megazygosporum TaxID=133381 RepID=A0A2T9Z652_9FUNG|nr:hypothetical protein BB560_005420 [Smittium megazygosporum]
MYLERAVKHEHRLKYFFASKKKVQKVINKPKEQPEMTNRILAKKKHGLKWNVCWSKLAFKGAVDWLWKNVSEEKSKSYSQ